MEKLKPYKRQFCGLTGSPHKFLEGILVPKKEVTKIMNLFFSVEGAIVNKQFHGSSICNTLNKILYFYSVLFIYDDKSSDYNYISKAVFDPDTLIIYLVVSPKVEKINTKQDFLQFSNAVREVVSHELVHKLQTLKYNIKKPFVKYSDNEAKKLVSLLADFAKGLDLLDDYDHQTLEERGKNDIPAVRISYEEFITVVDGLRRDFDSQVFGKPKDNSFESSVNQIYQSFDGQDVYPTTECKAANLLYLVTKNHSFVDGNKRIAAAVFIYFLEKNTLLYRMNGKKLIDNEALAALTLLIAVSRPEEKETMIKFVMTMLNRNQN